MCLHEFASAADQAALRETFYDPFRKDQS